MYKSIAIAVLLCAPASSQVMRQNGTGALSGQSLTPASVSASTITITNDGSGSACLAIGSTFTVNCQTGKVGVMAGVNTATAAVGGTIFYQDFTTSASTTTGPNTSNMSFSTFTAAANMLARNGDCLILTCAGSLANTGNSKRAYISLNDTSSRQLNTGNNSGNAVQWEVYGSLCRSGSGTQVYGGRGQQSGQAASVSAGTLAATDTAAIPFYCGCTNASSVQGDCSFLFFRVDYKPAP